MGIHAGEDLACAGFCKPPRAEHDPGLCTECIEFCQFVLRRYTAVDAKPIARTRIAAIGADFRRCQAAKLQHDLALGAAPLSDAVPEPVNFWLELLHSGEEVGVAVEFGQVY